METQEKLHFLRSLGYSWAIIAAACRLPLSTVAMIGNGERGLRPRKATIRKVGNGYAKLVNAKETGK